MREGWRGKGKREMEKDDKKRAKEREGDEGRRKEKGRKREE